MHCHVFVSRPTGSLLRILHMFIINRIEKISSRDLLLKRKKRETEHKTCTLNIKKKAQNLGMRFCSGLFCVHKMKFSFQKATHTLPDSQQPNGNHHLFMD